MVSEQRLIFIKLGRGNVPLELSVKSLKEERNCRFDSLRKLSIKSSLAHRVSKSSFWDLFFFHLSNFEKILGRKHGMHTRLAVLNLELAYSKLAWPTHSSRTS